VPVVRNLDSLIADIKEELRQVLFAIYEYERGMPAEGPPPDVAKMIEKVERKTRNVIELMTGSRL